MRRSVILAVVLLGSTVLATGLAVAQDGGGAQDEVHESLTEIESFIASILGTLGVIVFLIGAAAYFMSSNRSDRAQWGWRAIWGGAGMIVLSVSYNVIVGLVESFAPGVIIPVV